MERESASCGTTGNGASANSIKAWDLQRGPRAAELLGCGTFSDLVLVAGEPPQRISASRLLLAAASKQLAQQLRLEEVAAGAELPLPQVSAAAARAVVAYSCGVERPFSGCSPVEARSAASALRVELPSDWWARCDKEGALSPSWEQADEHLAFGSSAPSAATVYAATPKQRLSAGHALNIAASICLAIAPLAAYLPTRLFNMEVNGFFMDDAMIAKNSVVVSDALDWGRLWRTDYWGLDMFDPNTWTHKSFRPFTVLTFRWNYILTGFNSCGFHVCNATLHAIASFQLFFFGLRVLRLPAPWSGLLAALFAAHPVHTESICYVVGRADILCAQVLLLAAEIYRPCITGSSHLTSWLCLCGALLLVTIAGLFKELGLTFFGFLVIWEALRITRGRAWRDFQRWLRIVVILIVGGTICFVRVWYTAGTAIARMDPYSNPIAASDEPWVRQLSYALVHGMYMKLLVWPSFLCYDYSMDAVPLVQSLSDVRLLLPVTTYLVFLQACTITLYQLRKSSSSSVSDSKRTSRRAIAEGLALSLAIFLLSFLPMTNILFPVGTLVAERLLYIPSIGSLCAGVVWIYVQVSSSRTAKEKRWKILSAWIVLLSTIVIWGLLCYRRVLDWSSVERITLVDGLKQLKSSRTQFNLANIYLMEQRHDEALVAYRRSIAADPQERDSQPQYHAGQILMYHGKHQEAERYLHKAVTGYFSPLTLHEEEVWHDYALALWHVGKGAEAVQNFQNAIITNPAFPKGYNNLACALVILGLSSNPPDLQAVQQGVQAMEQAVTLLPGMPLYWRNAAALLSLTGDAAAARGAWDRYRQLDPASAAQIESTGSLPQDCVWEFYFR